VTTLSEATGES